MDISGLGGLNNPLRLNPNQINAPDLLPSKLPPALDDKTAQKAPPQAPQQTGLTDTPAKPVINKNLQSFQNLLTEIGVPNTPQNNQLAQTLANYGQPVNKNTMNQVANSLGPIMQQNPANIEAGVVLLINNMPVTQKSVESVKHMLTGGGLSQNLLSLNKDLQKLVDNVKDKDFVKKLESKIQVKEGNFTEVKDLTQTTNIKNSDSDIKPMMQSPLLQNSDKNINESGQVKKNPFEEEFQGDTENAENANNFNQPNNQSKGLVKSNDKSVTQQNQGFSLLDFDENTNQNNLLKENIINNNPQNIVNNLINKAQKVNVTLSNIINADILKNPSNFPQQISMLKKQFADLEVDVEEIKEILESSFSELKDESVSKSEDENIFTNLLKMVFEDNPKVTKKNKTLNNINFENDLLKNLTEVSKSIAGDISGRELLANNQQCLCIPLTIPFNNKIYQAEIMINREDNSNKKAEVGEVPLKINLSIHTHNMGKVGVDMSNLKQDLQVHLNVDNISIKNAVTQKIMDLQNKLNDLPFDVKPISCSVNPRPDESNSLLLPKKYQVMSMRRIDGIA